MTEKHFLFNDTQVFYTTDGDGLAVVLVHGFAEDGTVWDSLRIELASSYKVFVIDLPGSGRSALPEKFNSGGYMSIEQMADCVSTMIQQENLETCILIGHSMGGYITMAFAENHPELLTGFGLFHSSAFADNQEKIDTRKKAIEHIKTNGAASFLKTSIPNLFAEKYKSARQDFIDKFILKYSSFDPAALIGYYYAMMNRPDRTRVLEASTVPVLFIIGEEDKAIPFADSMKQCYLPRQSHVNILPETGHMGMIESEDETNKIVLAFCDTVSIGNR